MLFTSTNFCLVVKNEIVRVALLTIEVFLLVFSVIEEEVCTPPSLLPTVVSSEGGQERRGR